MELGLFQEQRLKLVMTNELRQAINILHYSSLELSDFLQDQAVENPLIDLQDFHSSYQKSRGKGTSEDGLYEVADNSEATIQKHLLNQLCYLKLNPKDKHMLTFLIELIDNNGYFIEDSIALSKRLSVPIGKIEALIAIIQQLEPVGVGARSLKECLLIQLKQLPVRNTLAETIVENHLTELAEKKWKKLSEQLAVSLKMIQDVFDLIQTLNPKPGGTFPTGKTEFVTPDLVIKKVGTEFRILTNEYSVPRISLNEYYERLLRSTNQKELTEYIQEKYQRYLWLQKSIEQRKSTLLKVMQAILDKQLDFFVKGPRYVKPLTLKEIAEEVELHESTISRATNGKYVQTPFGLFELKHFFSSSVSSSSQEEDVSSDAVKQTLKEIIDNENKSKPLSDQAIVSILKKEHSVNVSRRTIAKYRDQLSIPSSTMRKRFD